jgi:hypothetical protein
VLVAASAENDGDPHTAVIGRSGREAGIHNLERLPPGAAVLVTSSFRLGAASQQQSHRLIHRQSLMADPVHCVGKGHLDVIA